MHKLYYCNIREIDANEFAEEYGGLSQPDRYRIDKIKEKDSAKRTLAGRLLARKAVADLSGLDAADIRIDVDEKGRPYAENAPVYFSISHCRERVVCVASKCNIGVDIERIKTVKSNLVKRVCCTSEFEYVIGKKGESGNLSEDALRRFFEVWTLKEAWFKYLGTGITKLRDINVLSDIPNKHTYFADGYVISVVTDKLSEESEFNG